MNSRIRSTSSCVAALCVLSPASGALANPAAEALGREVAERPANEGRVGRMHFTMRNASGRERKRSAVMMHSDFDDVVRIAIYFTHPASIEDTAFLSHDHKGRSDFNWLFLPATDRVRRLPASDQRDSFIGTDLSYGDIKSDFKFPVEEWRFTETGDEVLDGKPVKILKGEALSEDIVDEIGYSKFDARIDPDTLFPVRLVYADPEGEPLKRMRIHETDRVGGVWTVMRFTVENLQTGHVTEVNFTDMRYDPTLDADAMAPELLSDGAPRLD